MFISFHLEPILQKVQHDARSSKTKDLVVFFPNPDEERDTAKVRARGAKREFFISSFRRRAREEQRGKHEARSAKKKFLHSDRKHKRSEGAGTRREARNFFFFIPTNGASRAKAQARGAKRENFFSSF